MTRSRERPGGIAYTPPAREDIREIDTARFGFTNGFFLKFPTLYAVGDLSLLDAPAVAIVGARKASTAGRERAAELARALVRDDVVVMSGLAAGVDEVAHRAAIDAGGRTIAVVGTPPDKVYPAENSALQERIYREHLLLSPFAPGGRFFPSYFPERNRVMARLARATVIIEAGDTSGSLHQAVASLEVGHLVFISGSVIRDRSLTWPARFVGKPHVHEMNDPSDVLDILLR